MEDQLFRQRITSLKQQMNERQIDVVMMTSPVNIYYFTGFYSDPHERFMALVIDFNTDEDMLFVPLLDLEAAKAESYVQNVITVSDTEDPFQIFFDNVSKEINRFGVEKKQLSLFQYEQIRQRFSEAVWIDMEGLIESFRLHKSPNEIKKISKAIKMIEEVMETGRKQIKVGMTETDLVAELEYQMRKVGSDGPSFSPIVLTGKKSALPHGHPGNAAIAPNDFVLIDMGVKTEGYCSDITRTFLVGEGSKEQEKLYHIVLESTQKAIDAVNTGSTLGSVDDAARSWITQAGYGDYFNNRVGHGLGLEVHEAPSVHGLNQELIAPGMVFTIEPGIYIPALGGVRIEDNVYVNESGEVEVLTSYPKQLIRV
ncbi:M24 family metallopeptidase [Sediminibacillus massiliensis]|uniref:M24 family metallopeptidase n=1 Tax=Sediminibacillus massiliensis TaxID=1926277 RepID=UPI001FE7FDE9|nr:Xaa-Pro peptidase family protein [Sediminibacillus massiliensis]